MARRVRAGRCVGCGVRTFAQAGAGLAEVQAMEHVLDYAGLYLPEVKPKALVAMEWSYCGACYPWTVTGARHTGLRAGQGDLIFALRGGAVATVEVKAIQYPGAARKLRRQGLHYAEVIRRLWRVPVLACTYSDELGFLRLTPARAAQPRQTVTSARRKTGYK